MLRTLATSLYIYFIPLTTYLRQRNSKPSIKMLALYSTVVMMIHTVIVESGKGQCCEGDGCGSNSCECPSNECDPGCNPCNVCDILSCDWCDPSWGEAFGECLKCLFCCGNQDGSNVHHFQTPGYPLGSGAHSGSDGWYGSFQPGHDGGTSHPDAEYPALSNGHQMGQQTQHGVVSGQVHHDRHSDGLHEEHPPPLGFDPLLSDRAPWDFLRCGRTAAAGRARNARERRPTDAAPYAEHMSGDYVPRSLASMSLQNDRAQRQEDADAQCLRDEDEAAKWQVDGVADHEMDAVLELIRRQEFSRDGGKGQN